MNQRWEKISLYNIHNITVYWSISDIPRALFSTHKKNNISTLSREKYFVFKFWF